MLLLHISDIHFNRDFLARPGHDPDEPIRTQLIRHARHEVQRRGPVDIAYRGAREEYEAARAWLSDLAVAVQCDPNRIYVVPGNHDVDQQVLKRNTAAHNAQIAIDTAPDPDAAFRRQTANLESAASLFASLAAYNDFAENYKCNNSFERLRWTHDLKIDEQTTLRLHGLVSCLLSGLDEQIDREPGRQYLNRTQIVICPEDNVINATLCHHPAHWFRNAAEINSLLRPSARLQFFGHIHDQQIELFGQNVRILAGALVPAYKGDSQPAYNFVNLFVLGQNPGKLQVEVSQFEWQPNPPRFRAKEAEDGERTFKYTVPIDRSPNAHLSTRTQALNQNQLISAIVEQSPMGQTTTSQEVPQSTWRETIDEFHNLPSSARREIALEIGVLTKNELALQEEERERITLERVRERALQVKFEHLVYQARGQ
jgi:hypothetical protein